VRACARALKASLLTTTTGERCAATVHHLFTFNCVRMLPCISRAATLAAVLSN